MLLTSQQILKIDDQAVLGLAGTNNSLAYRVHEIEKHFHSANQVWGWTSNTLTRKSTTPVQIGSGTATWGAELILTPGNAIEGGLAASKFDMHDIVVIAVTTANRVQILEFFSFDAGTPKVAAAATATEKITDATNTVANNDKIFFTTFAAATTGINLYTVYYVVNRAAGDFEVSLTREGAAVNITGVDGAVSYVSLGASDGTTFISPEQTLITEAVISAANTNSDSFVVPTQMSRQTCNKYISCRGISTAAGTNTVDFFVHLHIYPA